MQTYKEILNEAYLQDWIDEQQALFKAWEEEGCYPGKEQDDAATHSEELRMEYALWYMEESGIAKCEMELQEACHG